MDILIKGDLDMTGGSVGYATFSYINSFLDKRKAADPFTYFYRKVLFRSFFFKDKHLGKCERNKNNF